MIVNATYVSDWDNGYEVATSCKFNKVTHEVTDIETSNVVEDFNILNREFIRLDDDTEIDSFITEEERIVINGEYIDEDDETTYIFHNGEILQFIDDDVLIVDNEFDLNRLSFKEIDSNKTLKMYIDDVETNFATSPIFDSEKEELTDDEKELYYIIINYDVTYFRDLKFL